MACPPLLDGGSEAGRPPTSVYCLRISTSPTRSGAVLQWPHLGWHPVADHHAGLLDRHGGHARLDMPRHLRLQRCVLVLIPRVQSGLAAPTILAAIISGSRAQPLRTPLYTAYSYARDHRVHEDQPLVDAAHSVTDRGRRLRTIPMERREDPDGGERRPGGCARTKLHRSDRSGNGWTGVQSSSQGLSSRKYKLWNR